MNIIKTLKSSISEKGNYCYSLPVETTKEIIKDVEQLQQENKELKEHIEKYEHYCKTTGIEELMKENIKYKEVIEKAIEYLDDWLFNVGGLGACMDYKDIKEILDILKEEE